MFMCHKPWDTNFGRGNSLEMAYADFKDNVDGDVTVDDLIFYECRKLEVESTISIKEVR